MNLSKSSCGRKEFAPDGTIGLRRSPDRVQSAAGAFTLVELLVVLVIIGLLAAIGLPSVRNINKSNAIIAANRQFLDDIGYARQRAIADHTTVYVLFIPPWITTVSTNGMPDAVAVKQYQNLYGGQYTTYALFSLRSSGEQPGRATPRYLTAWRNLPNGVFIATNKFTLTTPMTALPFSTNTFPFPYISTATLPPMNMPYIGFDYLGRLITGRDEDIPLARGSIFYARGLDGGLSGAAPTIQEIPPNNSVINSNVIHIDWLTGRARVERQELQ